MTYWWHIGDKFVKYRWNCWQNLALLSKQMSYELAYQYPCQQNLNLSDNNSKISSNCWRDLQTFHSMLPDDLMLVTISEIGDEISIWRHFDEVGNKGKRMTTKSLTLSPKTVKLSPTFWQIACLKAIIIFENKFETHHYELANGEAQR